MSFGKSNDKLAKSRSKDFDDQIIDASPGDGPVTPPSGRVNYNSNSALPSNIRETKAWKNITGGLKSVWANYLATLATAFRCMSRSEQIELIVKSSQIITIGVAVVGLGLFYYFLNVTVRVIATPALLVGAWFLGTRVVAPVMITRLEKLLND